MGSLNRLTETSPSKIIFNLLLLLAVSLSGCGGGGGTTATPTTGSASKANTSQPAATLTSISITPANAMVGLGQTANFTATGVYSDSTTADLTTQVSWSSANTGIASVAPSTGIATGVAAGNTAITASMGGVTSMAASISVNASSLTGMTISPATISAPQGQSVTFSAMGTYANGATGNISGSATWSSSNNAVATVSAAGVATTLSPGTTTITAIAFGLTRTATLTVTAPVTSSGPLAGVNWTYAGTTNANWMQVADATVPNGGSVFQAPALLDLQTSTASVTVTVPVAGNVSFYYKVSSETNYDFLTFSIDGVPVTGAHWSGLVPWALATYPITAGTHTLKWDYTKDVSVSSNLDTAWISQVSIPAGGGGAVVVGGPQMGGAIQGTPLSLTGSVTTLAGSTTAVAGAVDGIGTAALFNGPSGVTTDGTNLYVADSNNHKIRRIVIATGAVSTLAGSGVAGAADGVGTAASFNTPHGITTDGTNLYVADSYNNKIRMIVIATGAVSTLAGSGMIGATDGMGSAASFSYPYGITTDGANLYVADSFNNKIRRVVIATGAVSTVAGSGTTGATDGVGTAALFNSPYGITTDGTNLYVADSYNNKIRKVVIATATVSTLAGSGVAGATNGVGTAATFDYPYGVTTDGTNLYVADWMSGIVRKIVIATGAVTTLAGNPYVFGSVNGVGAAATFNGPFSLTTDGISLYTTDNLEHNIRKIQ